MHIHSVCTGREIRTPINGFGDRYSAIELCPWVNIKIRKIKFQIPNFNLVANGIKELKVKIKNSKTYTRNSLMHLHSTQPLLSIIHYAISIITGSL